MNVRARFLCFTLPAVLLISTFIVAPQSGVGLIVAGILKLILWASPLIAAIAIGWFVRNQADPQTEKVFGLSCAAASAIAMFIFMCHASAPAQFTVLLASICLAVKWDTPRSRKPVLMKSVAILVVAMLVGTIHNHIRVNDVTATQDKELFAAAYQVGADTQLRAQADKRVRVMVDQGSWGNTKMFRTWLLDTAPIAKARLGSRGEDMLNPEDLGIRDYSEISCFGADYYQYVSYNDENELDDVLRKRLCVMRVEDRNRTVHNG